MNPLVSLLLVGSDYHNGNALYIAMPSLVSVSGHQPPGTEPSLEPSRLSLTKKPPKKHKDTNKRHISPGPHHHHSVAPTHFHSPLDPPLFFLSMKCVWPLPWTSMLDSFTVPLHSPNLGLCKRTVTGVWKSWEFPLVTWAHDAIHRVLGYPNLYLDQPITKGWCQSRLGLCSSLRRCGM